MFGLAFSGLRVVPACLLAATLRERENWSGVPRVQIATQIPDQGTNLHFGRRDFGARGGWSTVLTRVAR